MLIAGHKGETSYAPFIFWKGGLSKFDEGMVVIPGFVFFFHL